MEELKGRVVIVTGASSGIGAATAEEFAKYGAYLSLTGRNTERLEKVAAKCSARGVDTDKILLISGDMSSDATLDSIVEKTIAKFGEIHVLVNNAGTAMAGTHEQTTMEILDQTYTINLRAPFFLAQKVAPHLKRSKGCIINVSSVAGLRPSLSICAYSIMKAAMDQFTKALAIELGPSGVRVNSVNPGEVRTNMQAVFGVKPEHMEEFLNAAAAKHPLQKVGDPEEIAAVIAFLASDLASFISGAVLPVDGALSATAAWSMDELQAVTPSQSN